MADETQEATSSAVILDEIAWAMYEIKSVWTKRHAAVGDSFIIDTVDGKQYKVSVEEVK